VAALAVVEDFHVIEQAGACLVPRTYLKTVLAGS
jgi:hypothetical protein